MSKRTIESIKKDKGFKIFDLILYGVIILIVAVSFIAVFATKNKSPLTGICVYYKEQLIFSYDFETDSHEIAAGYDIEVSEGGESLSVRISTDEGYNLIEIEKKGRVSVKDADCHGHDCVYSPAISDSNGIIFCSPHMLKITPKDYDDSKITM